MEQHKLIRITTVPISLLKLIKGQANYMQKKGFEVLFASSKADENITIKNETGIEVDILPLTRVISPFADLKALWLSYKYIKRNNPLIVHTHTPKAGLIGMLASKFSKVPIRMHTVAGLPLMEANGIKRTILNLVEKITSWAATGVYPNSYALKDFMVENKLAPISKLKVIGNGSSNGIDLDFFSLKNTPNYHSLRKELKIEDTDIVFCFVGRIVKDKGINELLEAFDKLNKDLKNSKLLIIGTQEKELDPITEKSISILKNNPNVLELGWQNDIRPYLAISDTFVFPSYREGFPNVVLQAGAMNLPSIVSDINGSNEIIQNNINGLIIPSKETELLYQAMKLLGSDELLRKKLSEPAREIIKAKYSQDFVWNELYKEYTKQINRIKNV